MMRLLIALLFLLVPVAAHAASITYQYVEQTTAQTTTSTSYTDVTGMSISSANLTTGKKYLVVARSTIRNTVNNTTNFIQTVHGSTAFAESEFIFQRAVSADQAGVYQFMTVWTAVASEGLKLQFKVNSGTGSVDQLTLLALCLDCELIENTDWFSATRTNDDTLSTTPTDGASITFTPGTAGHDWLVISYAQFDSGDTTNQQITQITRSGEASSTAPSASYSVTVAAAQPTMMLLRAFNLGAASNTFKEQASTSSGTAHVRLHSNIVAINLNKFRDHTVAYTAGSTSLTTTDFGTQAQTASITPTVASDVFIFAFLTIDPNGVGGLWGRYRTQLDNSDVPSGVTADVLGFTYSNSTSDRMPSPMATRSTSVSAASHAVDLDAGTSGATTLGRDMAVVLFTAELAVGSIPALIGGDCCGGLIQ